MSNGHPRINNTILTIIILAIIFKIITLNYLCGGIKTWDLRFLTLNLKYLGESCDIIGSVYDLLIFSV